MNTTKRYWSAAERSVTGFVSNLKGKVAEMRAEDLLEDRFPGYDFSVASDLDSPGWDLHGVAPEGQDILVQVKMGGEGYVADVLERMRDDPAILFATSSEIIRFGSEVGTRTGRPRSSTSAYRTPISLKAWKKE